MKNLPRMKKPSNMKTFASILLGFGALFLLSCTGDSDSADPELSRQKYYTAIHEYNASNIDRYNRELIEAYKIPRLNNFIQPTPSMENLKRLGVNTVSTRITSPRIEEFQENGFQLLSTNKLHTSFSLLEENPGTHQVIFGCSKHVRASQYELEIDLQTENNDISYEGDDYWRTNAEALSYPGDKYWRVFDATGKKFLARDQWERDPNSTVVKILRTEPGHEYGVLYQTKQIHAWIAKRGTINPMFEEIDDVFIKWQRDNYAAAKGILDVYRPTSARMQRGGGWFGYLGGTNPEILEEFEEWAGDPFEPAWVLNDDFQLIIGGVPMSDIEVV